MLVVVEWARERFDEATARWCFDRIAADGTGWLHRHREDWQASGQPWDDYLRDWVESEGLHASTEIMRAVTARFDPVLVTEGPYFFADLDGITAADEQGAIDAGHIQANGLRFVGRRRL